MTRASILPQTLVVVPALRALVRGDCIAVTKKFVAGVQEFERRWPGPVRLLMHPSSSESENLDTLTFSRDGVPFDLTIAPLDSDVAVSALLTASVALLSLEFRQTGLSSLCRKIGVPCAYTTENTLRTRVQIARAETRNPLRLARRIAWEVAEERKYIKAIRSADGVQCNGTPTFDSYAQFNRSPLLFFDTRSTASNLARDSDLQKRFEKRRSTGMLRLAFSGRLISIKGVKDLVKVARALSETGVDFSLSICGSGECEPWMRSYVQQHGLDGVVKFMGNLDFEAELLPFMRQEVDLFICCHGQGDPSCTYLETLACGVPIAGYGNEAWRGLSRESGCGWVTPMNRPEDLAMRIASLSDAEIDEQSLASLEFAQAHTFEIEFAKRIEQLKSLASVSKTGPR